MCRSHFKWPVSEVREIRDAVSSDSRFTHGDSFIWSISVKIGLLLRVHELCRVLSDHKYGTSFDFLWSQKAQFEIVTFDALRLIRHYNICISSCQLYKLLHLSIMELICKTHLLTPGKCASYPVILMTRSTVMEARGQSQNWPICASWSVNVTWVHQVGPAMQEWNVCASLGESLNGASKFQFKCA